MKWIWKKGIVGTFLTGFFTLLPILLTVGIIVWAAGYAVAILGPDTLVGSGLKQIGLKFVTSEIVAYLIGLAAILCGIWAFGLLVKSKAKNLINALMNVPKKIPLINSIYGTVQQIVKMIKKEEGDDDFSGMNVVYCYFDNGGGFLALSPPGSYSFALEPGGRESVIVYIPTSPVPMTGGLIFWPKIGVRVIDDMTVDAVMQHYLSLGVLGPQAIPEQFHVEVPTLSMLRQYQPVHGGSEQ
jgi:uncharacterized membrane protein